MTPRLLAAVSFAARAHAGQTRKDGKTPYAAHPMRVAMIVRDAFGCEDEIALLAALLHDTIEDTTTDYDDVSGAFGAEVADVVASLTKNMALPEAQREREYDERLSRGGWRAAIAKLGDAYDNLSDTEAARPEKRAKFLEKCRRAIEIARPHAAERPEVARAIAAVEALLRG